MAPPEGRAGEGIRATAKFEALKRGYSLARRKGVSKVLARRQLERRLVPLAGKFGVPPTKRKDVGVSPFAQLTYHALQPGPSDAYPPPASPEGLASTIVRD